MRDAPQSVHGRVFCPSASSVSPIATCLEHTYIPFRSWRIAGAAPPAATLLPRVEKAHPSTWQRCPPLLRCVSHVENARLYGWSTNTSPKSEHVTAPPHGQWEIIATTSAYPTCVRELGQREVWGTHCNLCTGESSALRRGPPCLPPRCACGTRAARLYAGT